MDTAPLDTTGLEGKVIEALGTCFDPEIPINIYELGLIYDVKVEASGEVHITMTLTSPNCPAALELPLEVEARVQAIPGVKDAKVDVVFDPPWDPSMMSEGAKLDLGFL